MASVAQAAGTPDGKRTEPAGFENVFDAELDLIRQRREESGRTRAGGPYERLRAFELRLVGLALSGGGIRSACFNLGLLQSLAKCRVLSKVDYLSTVSGGGYIGSCLSSLLSEKGASVEPGPDFPFSFDGTDESPVIKHLRRHGDYLAVMHGLFRLDTWRLASAYLGGLLLSLGTVLLLIAAVAASGVALWQLLFFGWQLRFAKDATVESALADAWRFLWEPKLYVGTILTPTLIVLSLWALMGLPYVVVKIVPRAWTLGFRRTVGRIQGFLLGLAAALAVAAAVPFVFVALTGALKSVAAALAGAGLASSLSLAGLARLGERAREAASKLERFRRVTIAAGAFVLVVVACLGVLYAVWLRPKWLLQVAVGSLAALVLLAVGGDINRISMFHFYRDRLSEAFVLRRRAAPRRKQGVQVENNDDLLLGDLACADRPAPYHIINACVNLPRSTEPEIRDRKADFFLLSPLYCGSGATGYVPTSRDAAAGPKLAWAMAVSGAAANPELGTRSSPALTFLLVMLNARLGVWAPNPRKRPGRDFGEARRPMLWPYYVLLELLSEVNEKRRLINLSDGGHIENLGVYELLRRRCRIIVCSDVSADPDAAFEDLGNLVRKARIDLGVRIELDLDRIRRGLAHAVEGKVFYPCPGGGADEALEGKFVYVKSALAPGDPQDLHEYRRSHPSFPHETTVDQFFDEAQFESYRELGYQSGKEVGAMKELLAEMGGP